MQRISKPKEYYSVEIIDCARELQDVLTKHIRKRFPDYKNGITDPAILEAVIHLLRIFVLKEALYTQEVMLDQICETLAEREIQIEREPRHQLGNLTDDILVKLDNFMNECREGIYTKREWYRLSGEHHLHVQFSDTRTGDILLEQTFYFKDSLLSDHVTEMP